MRWLVAAVAGGFCLSVFTPQTTAQDSDSEPTATINDQARAQEGQTPSVAASAGELRTDAPKDPTTYGKWVLIPALVAILLAIITRQVIPALLIGVFTGAYMLVPCLATDDPLARLHVVIAGFRLGAEKYLLGAITDPSDSHAHISIIVFTLIIGFTVGVIGRNGGTEGLVRLVAGNTNSRRRGTLTAWLAGMVVFFDDYANTMIVGPTMRPIFDRLKISRAKLAYIVDSTAAPVASIALIGTWVGAEIAYIKDGLTSAAAGGAPAFLLNDQGEVLGEMQTFLYSIPYRFYPILALVLVFLLAITGRDFGPMKRAERKSLSKIDPVAMEEQPGVTDPSKAAPRWWLGLLPILVLVVATVVVLTVTGYHGDGGVTSASASKAWWVRAADTIAAGDPYMSIFHGALLSALTAFVLTMLARACSIRDTIDAGLEGMTTMFPAMVILVLAWALSGVMQDLRLGDVAVAYLRAMQFPAVWLPLAVFLCAAVISFATGTSWGTMGILCPATVMIAAGLLADLDPTEALSLFYASVGSVLAGAVFGDHCSPISDTTVLSSIASGCRHEEHVWTQLPYAMLAAVVAMLMGDVFCSVLHQPWYYGLAGGAILLFVVVYAIGRRPVPSFELADA